jgi:hypothetical protein
MLNIQQREITLYLNCSQIAVKCRPILSQIPEPAHPFSSIDLFHSHEKTTCTYGRVNGGNFCLIAQSFMLSLLHQLFESLSFVANSVFQRSGSSPCCITSRRLDGLDSVRPWRSHKKPHEQGERHEHGSTTCTYGRVTGVSLRFVAEYLRHSGLLAV